MCVVLFFSFRLPMMLKIVSPRLPSHPRLSPRGLHLSPPADSHPTPVSLLVDCTSGDASETVKIGSLLLSQANIDMVDAPISGGPRGAEAGTVTGMFGGDSFENVETAMGLASFCGKKSRVGKLGSGHAVKSVNNIMNTAHLMIATEGMLALKRAGVDVERALQCVNESSGRSLQSEVRLPEEVLSRRFGYGFDLQLMQKDVSFARNVINSGSGGFIQKSPAKCPPG